MGTVCYTGHSTCGLDQEENTNDKRRQSYHDFNVTSHIRTQREQHTLFEQTKADDPHSAPTTSSKQDERHLVSPQINKAVRVTSASSASATVSCDIVDALFNDENTAIHDVKTLQNILQEDQKEEEATAAIHTAPDPQHSEEIKNDKYIIPTKTEQDEVTIEINELQTSEDRKSHDLDESDEAEAPQYNLQLDDLDTNSLRVIQEKHAETAQKTSSFRIQVEQLPEFKDNVWILDKNRTRGTDSPASNNSTLKAYSYDTELFKKKRVTLTNTHSFLWLTSIIQGAGKMAEIESEITRPALDKMLGLLPVPYRDKIWELCNMDDDTFIVVEEFEDFVDSLLIATGQYIIEIDDDELMFEIRDMSQVFREIVSISNVFAEKKCVAKTVSKHVDSLSTYGATKVIMLLRNMKKETEIKPNDICIPLLTGFTKKAIKHSVKYCTRLFWKILTDIWWDEDDEEDLALPKPLTAYTSRKRHSRQRSKVSQDIRKQFSTHSMDDLFGRLNFARSTSIEDSELEEEEESDREDANHLNI